MDAPKLFVKHVAAADAGKWPPAHDRLVLPFERRQKTRQRVRLESGADAALVLPRGTVLRGGDRVLGADGTVVEVAAAPEDVSTVRGDGAVDLARAAYHLGNRHVPVEVGAGHLRYLRDHVLDSMVRGLGLEVTHERAPFEPEAGAYGHGDGHAHGAHGHAHAQHDHHGRGGHDHTPAHGHRAHDEQVQAHARVPLRR
ncbi:MAG TPA: urease accessory protein UreE [Gammaproteobacteria bacterium]